LPDEVFRYLRRHLKPDATILELGSGEGTKILVDSFAKVYSVEHNPEFLGKVDGTTYIHAPLRGVWYDTDVLASEMPEEYDCLIVDGPPQNVSRRHEILRHLELFKPTPTVVDDIQYGSGRDITVGLASAWKVDKYSVHILSNTRGFSTIGWDDL
jgi:hypothetical protein